MKTNIVGERVDVLDKGWIELLDIMGDDKSIVDSARVSYMAESSSEQEDKALLLRLMKSGHTSPFEQVEFRFRVKAPVIVMWQWMRHRTWSFNSQSGRYTAFNQDSFHYPAEWRGRISDTDAVALDNALAEHYLTSFSLYKEAIGKGVPK